MPKVNTPMSLRTPWRLFILDCGVLLPEVAVGEEG